jgi:amino-acid N-acetyltransferase
MNQPSFSLRPAKEQDSPAIHDLIREGQINPTALDWRRFILAVSQDGEVIGCGQIKPHQDGSQELASIAVTGAWRGRGAARAVIEALIERHAGPLYLVCQSSLGVMYEKFGFKPVEEPEMPKYFRRLSKIAAFIVPLRKRGESLLVMRRE